VYRAAAALPFTAQRAPRGRAYVYDAGRAGIAALVKIVNPPEGDNVVA
jgi:hypothetical protein